MKVLQVSFPKTGSYWVYNILKEIRCRSGLPWSSHIERDPIGEIARTWDLSFRNQFEVDVIDFEERFIRYRIANIYQMPIEHWANYIKDVSIGWSHSGYKEKYLPNYRDFDRHVYVCRDPRATFASMARFMFTPYRQKYFGTIDAAPIDYMRRAWLPFCFQWWDHVSSAHQMARSLDLHIVAYEKLRASPQAGLRELVTYLGFDMADESLNDILVATDSETARRRDPGHVQKAQGKGWKYEIPPRIATGMRLLLGAGLAEAGYDSNGDYRPRLMTALAIARCRRAIRWRARILKRLIRV